MWDRPSSKTLHVEARLELVVGGPCLGEGGFFLEFLRPLERVALEAIKLPVRCAFPAPLEEALGWKRHTTLIRSGSAHNSHASLDVKSFLRCL